MSGLVAIAAGLLMTAGLISLVAGLRRREPAPRRPRIASSPVAVWARLTRRPAGTRGRRRDLVLVLSLFVGLALAAATGWLVVIGLAPALALGLPYLLKLPRAREVELLEALDRWVRSLAATLSTGRSITDAIRISRRTAPPLIAEEVNTLVIRLNNRWDTREALLRFADTLDSPDSDGVVAALMLAANRGADGASLTLQALADSIQAQLKGRRVIEIERSKPYVVVRQVTVISLATLAVIWVAAPDYFSAYKGGIGQVILSVLMLLYLGSLLLMRRKAEPEHRPRILLGGVR